MEEISVEYKYRPVAGGLGSGIILRSFNSWRDWKIFL